MVVRVRWQWFLQRKKLGKGTSLSERAFPEVMSLTALFLHRAVHKAGRPEVI